MKPNESSEEKNAVEALGEDLKKRKLSGDDVQSGIERVWTSLGSQTYAVPEDVVADLQPRQSASRGVLPGVLVAVAAAAAVVIAVSMPLWKGEPAAILESGALARVSAGSTHEVTLGGRIDFDEVVRANGAGGAILTLVDGSQIEMRTKAELALETAKDGSLIRLDRGSVIVTAAKQREGHLYLKTRDITVSVVGTVFLVSAEEAGSRVAVIEGKVQVQQGAVSKLLLPGEQMDTAPNLKKRSVAEEIDWSANSAAHALLLAQSKVEPPSAPPEPPVQLTFGVASVRIDGPFTQDGGPLQGFACQGQDGVWRASLLGKNLSFAARGRCVGRRVSLIDLIAAAYGVPRGSVELPYQQLTRLSTEFRRYGVQIEASAENPNVTIEQLRVMLQNLLAGRFKLKVRRETRDGVGCALILGKDRVKMKPSSEEPLPPRLMTEGTRRTIAGRSSMIQLADFLSRPRTGTDRTGLSGIYEYSITLDMVEWPAASIITSEGNRVLGVPIQDVSCEAGSVNPNAGEFQSMQYSPKLTNALQTQLGLAMKSETLPVEHIVVEDVDNPSEN